MIDQPKTPVESNSLPRISVIVPYYQNGSTIEECLTSILSQSYDAIEVIVVDDASPDGRRLNDVLGQFHDPRIRLVHHDVNQGLAAARNTGISEAHADWVLPVDGDDRLSPDFFDRAAEVIYQHLNVDAIFTDHLYFGDFSYVKNRYIQTEEEVLDHHSIPGAGTLYKRQLWERVGGYCEAPLFRAGNEDWDFWLSAYEVGFIPYHISEPLYEYRRSAGSMVDKLQKVDFKVRMEIYRRHSNLFDKYGMRNTFIARGFENSARAYLKQHDYWNSVWLSLLAWVVVPTNKKMAKLIQQSLVLALSKR